MRNPLTLRPRALAPDAATLHMRQKIATLAGELAQAQEAIAQLSNENAALRSELARAQEGYAFYFAEYRRNCAVEGKHQ